MVLSTLLIAAMGVGGLAGSRPAYASQLAVAAPDDDLAPMGWASLERVDLLPFVWHGVSTVQDSSADPTGENDDGFDGRYSCLHRVAQGCVMAEHHGPGELESVWTAGNWSDIAFSGRLTIELDDDTVVRATWPQIVSGRLGDPFMFPLTLGEDQSHGGASINVPMPFRHEMRVIGEFNPHYFHVVFRTFTSAKGIRTFSPRDRVPGALRAELGGADQRPDAADGTRFVRKMFAVPAGRRVMLARVTGIGAINQLRLRVARYAGSGSAGLGAAATDVFEHARLRISFDGRRTVDAPLGEFFGSGLGPAPVRGRMFAMDGGPHGWASSWWPMPFSSGARIELYNASHSGIARGQLEVSWASDRRWIGWLGPRGNAGYFHAQGHRGATRSGSDWQFLEARGSGTFVGVTMTMEGSAPPVYLEGNERAFVDGARTPQIQGTGTEDFFGGGWYFFDQLFTLPLIGYTAHETSATGCPTATCKSAYRIMIADAVPFSRSIRYEIQHGPRDRSAAIYSSTAYWYERGGT